MTAIVLQARIDSTRLPGKALLLIEGKPLIFRVMQALNQVTGSREQVLGNREQRAGDELLKILACSEDSYDSFKPFAEEAGFEIFAGPKEDVLERYCQVIRRYSVDRVIRATGDNPFVFADAVAAINNEAISKNADYAGYLNLPYGSGVESVAASALLRAATETANPFDHEHVCPYLYNNPEKFNIYRPDAPLQWHHPDIRLTVDTQEDFERAVRLYSALKNETNKHNGDIIIKKYSEIFR